MRAGRALTIASYLAPCAFPAYQVAARLIGLHLDVGVRFVEGDSPRQLLTGEVDAAFLCGLPYVRLADRDPRPLTAIAAPVLAGRRYGGRPMYFSDVIVRRDDPARTLEDLPGRAFAYNEETSYSGWLVVWHHLGLRGPRPGFTLSPTLRTGSHQASIAAVSDGQADWAAIDSQVLAITVRNEPRLAARLRVLESLGPSPVPPFVARTAIPEAVRKGMAEALRDAAGFAFARGALAGAGITGFVEACDADYDPIRLVAGSSRYAGLASIA